MSVPLKKEIAVYLIILPLVKPKYLIGTPHFTFLAPINLKIIFLKLNVLFSGYHSDLVFYMFSFK